MRIVVVLPAAFGPRRPQMRPAPTVNVRSLTATSSPYFLVSSRTSIMFTSAIRFSNLRQAGGVASHALGRGDAHKPQGGVQLLLGGPQDEEPEGPDLQVLFREDGIFMVIA